MYTGPGDVGSGRRLDGCAESGGLSNGSGSGVRQASSQIVDVDGGGEAGGNEVDLGVSEGVVKGSCCRYA